MTAEEIAAKLAQMDPSVASEIDGDALCFFCNASEPRALAKHESDCLWRIARETSHRAVAAFAAILQPLNEEERREILAELPFCKYCGRDDPGHSCQCWNDE